MINNSSNNSSSSSSSSSSGGSRSSSSSSSSSRSSSSSDSSSNGNIIVVEVSVGKRGRWSCIVISLITDKIRKRPQIPKHIPFSLSLHHYA